MAAAGLSKTSRDLYFPANGSPAHSLLEHYALLPELPEMMAALGDTPPALGIPTLIAEIWRLLRQRKELARVISSEIRSSVESSKAFAEEIAPPAYQSLAGYLDRGMNRGVVKRRNALAAAQCLIGTLCFFLLTQEVKVGEDLHPLTDETVVTTVARMFLDSPAENWKHTP
jgi:AefR-like transcriptional repressor, C-terminal domain